jgi:hypothetical protein
LALGRIIGGGLSLRIPQRTNRDRGLAILAGEGELVLFSAFKGYIKTVIGAFAAETNLPIMRGDCVERKFVRGIKAVKPRLNRDGEGAFLSRRRGGAQEGRLRLHHFEEGAIGCVIGG